MKTDLLRRSNWLTLFTLLVLGGRPAFAAGGTLVVTLPAGDFTLWLEYQDQKGAAQTTVPVKASGAKAALDLAPLGGKFTKPVLVAVDAAGNAAAKPAPAKPGATTEMSLSAADINAVSTLRVRAVDTNQSPAAGGSVTLKDSKGSMSTRPILPGHDGAVEFDRVPFGKANLKVLFPNGTNLAQDVEVKAEHTPGALTFELAAAAPLGEAGNTPAANAPAAANTPAAANAPASDTAADPKDAEASATDTPPAQPAQPAPATGTGGVGTLVGLLLLGAIAYVGVRVMRDRGIKVSDLLQRAGVELPGAEPAAEAAKPTPAPVVPDGHCPFCGQMKDPATGACACSVDAAATFTAAPVLGNAPAGLDPRVVAVQGPAMGSSFVLDDEMATIGRTPENRVALSQDSTVSRRHASLTRQGDSYLLRDEGSANGTFVNGMRITERLLQPGDEIQVGSTRLRFER